MVKDYTIIFSFLYRLNVKNLRIYGNNKKNKTMQENLTLKPYLINAFYSWCMDHVLTPLVLVTQHPSNVLPPHLAHEKFILLSIHPKAVRNMIFGKDTIEFEAMFDEISCEITLSYAGIASIINKESMYGLDFEVETNIQGTKKSHLTLIKNDD